MSICFSFLPKLAPPAVPVRYPYNLCLHTVSIMIPHPVWGGLRFSLWRRNLPPFFISPLLSTLRLTHVTLLQVYSASGCLPRLDSVFLISCHFSISINILSDQSLDTLVLINIHPIPKNSILQWDVSPRQPDPLRRWFKRTVLHLCSPTGNLMAFCGSHRAPSGSH